MSHISSISSAYPVSSTQNSPPPTPKPAQQKAAAPPQDTVHLSDAAKAAALGDADHDGDSH
jgi:hypothetical protein